MSRSLHPDAHPCLASAIFGRCRCAAGPCFSSAQVVKLQCWGWWASGVLRGQLSGKTLEVDSPSFGFRPVVRKLLGKSLEEAQGPFESIDGFREFCKRESGSFDPGGNGMNWFGRGCWPLGQELIFWELIGLSRLVSVFLLRMRRDVEP